MNEINPSPQRVDQRYVDQPAGSMGDRSVVPQPSLRGFFSNLLSYFRKETPPPAFDPNFHPPVYQQSPVPEFDPIHHPPAFQAQVHQLVEEPQNERIDFIPRSTTVNTWDTDYEGGEYRNPQNPLVKLTFATGRMQDGTRAKSLAIKNGENRMIVTKPLGSEVLQMHTIDRNSWNITNSRKISQYELTPMLRDISYNQDADALNEAEVREASWFQAKNLVDQFMRQPAI